MGKLLCLTELFSYCEGRTQKPGEKEASLAFSRSLSDDNDKQYASDVLTLSYLVIKRMKLQNEIVKLQYAIEEDRVYALLDGGNTEEVPFFDYQNFDSPFELGLIHDATRRYEWIDKIQICLIFRKASHNYYGHKKFIKPIHSSRRAHENSPQNEDNEWWTRFLSAYKTV
jgi:hypothetical protein